MQDLEKYISNTTPLQLFVEGGIEAVLSKIEAQARAIVPDLSTAGGRKAIASIAAKVARSKTVLDEMGKSLTVDLRKQVNAIDAERRQVRNRLDTLKTEVRAPLTAYEDRGKLRLQNLTDRVNWFRTTGVDLTGSEDLRARLNEVRATSIEGFEELTQTAFEEKVASIQRLDAALVLATQHEADELLRQRREAEAREKALQEQAERIAQEKIEAVKHRREQEQREAEARERRLAEEKIQAERRAIEAEARERLLAEQASSREAAEIRKAEEEKRITIERQASVHRALEKNLMAIGLDKSQAKLVVVSVFKGRVPQLKIIYTS